ncbi:MAG: protein kinase [Myxococcales bacterium]|nr:protein kinase [Myxococcales bacterium]
MVDRPFGPYHLVRQIAVGGMAEIHLAKTRGLAGFEKFVALKMIHPNFAQDEQFIEMLVDEAKIAVQLQHVNIAHTFDLGRVGETYYIVMEFVDGADLYQILRKGSERDLEMPVDVAAFVAKEMANGLDYAHRKRDGSGQPMGIVHRDVSPQNVLVSTAGEVKLVDFGIAKATMKARQTAVGVIKGKYYYMSPEQAWGERIDHRSDIFSAGIVLYEMLTSQMLYLEEDIPRLLEMVRKADIRPVRTLRKDVPPQLERIVMRALAKRAADRYPSAGELATDLERFLHTYSPVFSATKVAGHLNQALGTDEPEVEIAPTAPVVAPRRARSESAIRRNTLVTQRSELGDENSVIFRVNELEPTRRGAPDPQAARASPRMITASTLPIADVDGEIESTLITGRPDEGPTAFDGPRGLRKAARSVADLGDDYEPTVVEQVPGDAGMFEDDGGPTQTRDAFPSAAVAEVPTAPRRRGEPPPALAAMTPTPSVSELRRPRESRRTPAGGVTSLRPPASPPPPPSVLRAIVGSHDTGAPMPRVARGAGAPLSDGVPSTTAEPSTSTSTTGAAGGRAGVPGRQLPAMPAAGSLDPAFDAPTSPGTAAVPPMPWVATPPPMTYAQPPQPAYPPQPQAQQPQAQHPQAFPTGLPAHLMPYAYGSEPAPGMPGMPGYPFPYGAPPPTTSGQLQALEIDEVPAQYRISSNRSWLVRALLALVLIGGGVAAAVLIIRGGAPPPTPASIVIESKPSGALVSVDGKALTEKTPVVWRTTPGARHDIDVTLAGYQPFHDTVLIPDGGGEVKVLAFLPAQTVKLKITSTPPGADVYLNGALKGRTPIELRDLTPGSATDVELRLKDYAPEHRQLTWGHEDEQTVDVRLRR